MTGEDRAAYLNLPQHHLHPEPAVSLHRLPDGTPVAVADLAPGVTMHVHAAAQARALADVYTKAARILEAAEPRILEGRSQPHGETVACEVVFAATLNYLDGRPAYRPAGYQLGISARCKPHQWGAGLESGVHTLAELAELARQHSGGGS